MSVITRMIISQTNDVEMLLYKLKHTRMGTEHVWFVVFLSGRCDNTFKIADREINFAEYFCEFKKRVLAKRNSFSRGFSEHYVPNKC